MESLGNSNLGLLEYPIFFFILHLDYWYCIRTICSSILTLCKSVALFREILLECN